MVDGQLRSVFLSLPGFLSTAAPSSPHTLTEDITGLSAESGGVGFDRTGSRSPICKKVGPGGLGEGEAGVGS